MRTTTHFSCALVLTLAALTGEPSAAVPPGGGDPPDPNEAPYVKILQPANNTTLSYGGLNFIKFTATASDGEDGSKCCAVKWTSGASTLGTGKTLEHVFSSPGAKTIKFTAKDSKGLSSTAQITLNVTNEPPGPQILEPAAADSIYSNVPFVVRGKASDLNELYFQVQCNKLEWKSNPLKPSFPVSACDSPVSLPKGAYQIKLTATDSFGKFASQSVNITVKDPPAGKPVVVIKKPANESFVEPSNALALNGFALDPENKAMTYKWTVKVGSTEKTLPNSNMLNKNWTPSPDVPFHCGGNTAKLCLFATDADNETGSDCAEIRVNYPPC